MARVAVSRVSGNARKAVGLYRFLAAREGSEFERFERAQQRRLENGSPRERYPRQRRLDAFADGAVVNVASGELLGWSAKEAGAPLVQRPSGRLPARVIVGPDDSLVFTDVDWAALFIEESGI